MTFTTYKLYFQTPIHISRGKLNSYESSSNKLHSDTIKAALFVTAKQLYGEAIAKSLHDTVRVSSAFPFDKDGHWLPRPLSFQFSNENADNRKALKRIQFFTTTQFEEILRGEQPTLLEEKEGVYTQPSIWKNDTTQRVWITNNPDQSTPFYLEKLYPKKEDSGLYFIVHTEGGDFDENTFEAALRLLGDNGFGVQRGLGNGQFVFEKGSFNLELPQNANHWVALSLYRPTEKTEIESALENSTYQFIKRGGWLNSPENEDLITIRKKAIMMFTEGSVFAFGEQLNQVLTKGIIEDIKPDWNEELHPVWRDGRSLFLPFN